VSGCCIPRAGRSLPDKELTLYWERKGERLKRPAREVQGNGLPLLVRAVYQVGGQGKGEGHDYCTLGGAWLGATTARLKGCSPVVEASAKGTCKREQILSPEGKNEYREKKGPSWSRAATARREETFMDRGPGISADSSAQGLSLGRLSRGWTMQGRGRSIAEKGTSSRIGSLPEEVLCLPGDFFRGSDDYSGGNASTERSPAVGRGGTVFLA